MPPRCGLANTRHSIGLGEKLVEHLKKRTTVQWEVMNASLGDTETLAHIQVLETMQTYHTDVILLLYAFNDIDYLVPVTPREGRVST